MPHVSSWEDAQNRYVPGQLRARGWLVDNVAQQRPNNAAFDLKIARPDGSIGPWEVNVAHTASKDRIWKLHLRADHRPDFHILVDGEGACFVVDARWIERCSWEMHREYLSRPKRDGTPHKGSFSKKVKLPMLYYLGAEEAWEVLLEPLTAASPDDDADFLALCRACVLSEWKRLMPDTRSNPGRPIPS
jgi:hypothetical protein